MKTIKHPTRFAAQSSLTEMGMSFKYRDPHTRREYWAYGDGTDAFLDHSATIDRVGGQIMVSPFTRKEAA